MPNWNFTDVRVTGPKEQIDKLYDIMSSLEDMDEPNVENGFGNRWYGCLVNDLGIDWESVYCRGSWSDLERLSDTELKWWDETAWRPLTEVFDTIEATCPGVKVYWICEEPGMAIYESNDVDHQFFDTKYIFYYSDGDTEYFDSDDELIDFANDVIKNTPELKVDKPVTTLDELDEVIEESDDIAYYPFVYKE